MNENHSKTVMTLQYEPLWKGTEGVLATKDVEQKPNEITERGCTTSSRSSDLLTSVSSLWGVWGSRSEQQRILQLLMLGNISVRVVCFAPFFKLVGTGATGEDAGLFPGVAAPLPDSLFSVFPSSLHPVLFLLVDRGVLTFFIVLSSSVFVLVEAVVLFCRSW